MMERLKKRGEKYLEAATRMPYVRLSQRMFVDSGHS